MSLRERLDRYSRPTPRAWGRGPGTLEVMPTFPDRDFRHGPEGGINAAKLLRARGGCLGASRRRRAWKTAISPAELSTER
jgi:hypothetical protein